MRIARGAPDLVASLDGKWVICAGAQLSLYDAGTQRRVARAAEALGGDVEAGFLGNDRLLAVVRGQGRTQLHGFAVPSLELIASLELEGRLLPLAFTAQRALVATESMESPRVVAITSKILVEPIAMREPLQLAAAAPEERLLAASRTREAQLECWDPLVRRALFRLNLPLMPKAERAGFASRRRLLWIASSAPAGTLEVYRFSDGRLQFRADLGAPIVGTAGHPEAPRLFVATQPADGATVALTELDFAHDERRAIATPIVPAAFCVVEGAAPALVLHAGVDGDPTWMTLEAALPEPTIQPTRPPAAATATAATTAAAAASDWRARLHAERGPAAATPAATDKAKPATRPTAEAAAAATAAPAAAATATTADERGAAHWRDTLCDWAAALLAHPKRGAAMPAFADDTTLVMAIERLALDAGAARALALVYGARLLGHGEGVAAATVARALAGGDPAGDDDWAEALGQGTTGALGLVRGRAGRLRLTAAAARFLDGAPARIPILAGGAAEAELPGGRVRVDAGGEALDDVGARLAERFGYDVALVAVPGQRPRPLVAARLTEARLRGAWPLVDVDAEPPAWLDALDEGPMVIAIRGAVPAAFAELPSL